MNQGYYASILDNNGKMILGLANMDNYEKLINYKALKTYKNKNIILDLNLPLKLIQDIIYKNSKDNYICICATSAHKVYKIKNLLKEVDTIILNKQESLTLTNKKTIKDSMQYLIRKNKKLNIIITNGKNSVNAYFKNINYLCKPPLTKVKNENGAGDALSAIFNYFFCSSFDGIKSLNKGICGGSLETSEYKNNQEKYLQKINKLARSVDFKILK